MTISYPDLTGQKGTKTAAGYDLDGAAISGSGQITLRTFGEALTDGDLPDGNRVICTVYKDETNWETILATFNNLATDTLSDVTTLTSDGTISNTDSVDIRVTASNLSFDQSRLKISDDPVTDSNFTLEANTLHRITCSGLTGEKNLILPDDSKAGDIFAFKLVTDSHATLGRELVLRTAAAGSELDGADIGTTADNSLRYFISGESCMVQSLVDGAAGASEFITLPGTDGRIPCRGYVYLSADTSDTPAATGWTQNEYDTAVASMSIGGITTTSGDFKYFTVRRDGKYKISLMAVLKALGDGYMITSKVEVDGGTPERWVKAQDIYNNTGGTITAYSDGNGESYVENGDTIKSFVYHTDTASLNLTGSATKPAQFTVVEHIE